MKKRVDSCIVRDALSEALLHTPSTPQQRRFLLGLVEEGEFDPVFAFLRARGWKVRGGSSCPAHVDEGLTLER